MRTIYSLQAGRGLAALAVVFHHANLASRDFAGFEIPLLRYGYLGVDFFFVLSGFIIYHSTVGLKALPDYALARFRRIYLPYWPVGIAMALLYLTVPTAREWHWLPTLTLAPIDASPALAVAWTLQHEILFYVLFGLLYYSGLLWLGLGAWALCIALGLPHLPFERINLEFFFGIGAAILYRKRQAHPVLMIFTVAFLMLWVLLGAKIDVSPVFGLALAFLIAPIAQLEREHFKVPRSLVLLGAASYSIYLVHDPAISIAARLGGSLVLPIGVLVGAGAGFAYHFLVERPIIKHRSPRRASTSLAYRQ